MDEKSLITLEFPKILERLVAFAAFSASAEMGRALRPTSDLAETRSRLARTTEARRLLDIYGEVGVGGTRDIRPLVDLARRGGVLQPPELLEVKNTLVSARELHRTLERLGPDFPHLVQMAAPLPPPAGIVDGISRAISERAEVMDHASDKLASIRRELKISHERLLNRLERMINDPHTAPMLQEPIITQRNGRYVIPLRADFKGKVRSIVHDQSSSGATLFVEPLVVVEMNNQWHELQLAERDEVRRILAELSALVGKAAVELEAMVQALAEIDLTLMCAKYAEDLHASEPLLEETSSKEDHPGSVVRLYQARHPLLDPQTVVAIDVVLDEQTFGLVITGPNTGGKTVTLKTVGLLVLMAQTGLHIPAQSGSALSLFKDVFADIGDEQSIEQSLSTFSGHITNIVRILKRAQPDTLVIFDELGAGTDPQEGAALARALLAHLVEHHIPCMVATHYPELKAYAHATPGIVNASMEFDVKSLRPTYHLTVGLPGRSNALLIAGRLGLSKEIIAAARSTIDPDELHAEDLLNEIHRQRDLARRMRGDAESARYEADKLRQQLAARMEKIEDERQVVLNQARVEAEHEVEGLRAELDEIRRGLARARQPLEALKPLTEKVEEIQSEVQSPVARRLAEETQSRPLRPGDKVKVRTLKMDGIITTLGVEDAEVQVGNLRVRARLADLLRGDVPVENPTPVTVRKMGSTSLPETGTNTPFHPSPGIELDLRGERAEDALDALDRYLENAYLAGLPFVRIIHGKGTGRLRQVIREALRKSPHVKRVESGQDNEGGEGVTIAHLDV
jgi:DNA mismatch repair protein MutS2